MRSKLIPEIRMILFATFCENISKKPLIPNTTKILKAKKIKISKNKFNPKNVFCVFLKAQFLIKAAPSKQITRTNDSSNAKNNHLS